MRAALVLLVLLAAGCARPACDACTDVWQAEGVDAAFAAALANATGAATSEPRGLALPDANLTAAWGPRYVLASLERRDANASVALDFGAAVPRVVLDAPGDAPWRPLLHALLANASPGTPEREARLAEALAANRSAQGRASVALDGPVHVAELWRAQPSPLRLTGNEDHYLDHGDPVVRGPWRFAFAFPKTTLAREGLDAQANPRGAYVVLLRFDHPADAQEARRAAQAGLPALPADLRLVAAR